MNKISRRSVLRGVGTAIALPWLESIMPRLAQAAEGGGPRRMAFFSVPNGMHMPDWTPKEEGPLSVLPPILAPLAAAEVERDGAQRADARRRQAAGATAPAIMPARPPRFSRGPIRTRPTARTSATAFPWTRRPRRNSAA